MSWSILLPHATRQPSLGLEALCHILDFNGHEFSAGLSVKTFQNKDIVPFEYFLDIVQRESSA